MIDSPQIITLTSDFGLLDPYVGIMKGVIVSINPRVSLIDLTHDIPAQNICLASFALLESFKFFPAGTIHLAIVDPGVGGSRRGIAVKTQDSFFVGPDNGIFNRVLKVNPPLTAINLTNPNFWISPNPKPTFHGRDIFAPVAAHLSRGVPIEQVGESIDLCTLAGSLEPECEQIEGGWKGYIQAIDRFGNFITSFPETYVKGKNWAINLGEKKIPGQEIYESVKKGELLALIGSHGYIEIAVNCGNAKEKLKVKVGDSISLFIL